MKLSFCLSMNFLPLKKILQRQDYSLGPQIHILLSILVFTLCFAKVSTANTFIIDGNTTLNSIIIPNIGTHRIRFTGAGYQNPGSLTLTNNNSDSIIFERLNETDSALTILKRRRPRRWSPVKP